MNRAVIGLVLGGVALMGALGKGVEEKPAGAAPVRERLRALFAREWEWRLRESPLLATSVGDHRHDDRLPSATVESHERRDRETAAFLAELGAIDAAALAPEDRIDRDIFQLELEERRAAHRYGEHELTLNADSGFHTDFAISRLQMPFETARHYRNYLARLRAFPGYMDEHIALLRRGLAAGRTVPRAALGGIESSIAPLGGADPERNPLWQPLASIPATIPEGERERLRAEARAVIADSVAPAYRRLREFMTGTYVPGARATLAASALPDGASYYRFLIRRFTTLDLEPDAIHRLGLAQVAEIRAEMEGAIRRAGFTGSVPAFLDSLRSDARFRARTAEELLKEASFIAKRMDAKLPELFGRLPRQPYGVAPVPDYLAPTYTAGRYVDAPLGRAATYWVNTYALDTRPLYNLEALTLHEAVPGHHLQIALAKELEGLPEFRRFAYFSGFGEGWGLYAEWLGKEAGFYTDPHSDFGRLSYAMWRAARLVVDTGIHARGWTRPQAIDYLAGHTALSLHECTTEVDRYISWPGQALAYKLGELEIRKLRRRAEQALGARFDLRRFHDAVLGRGAVPLGVLEREIDRFIAGERGGATP